MLTGCTNKQKSQNAPYSVLPCAVGRGPLQKPPLLTQTLWCLRHPLSCVCKSVHLSHLYLLCQCKASTLTGMYALVQPGGNCMYDLSTKAKLLTMIKTRGFGSTTSQVALKVKWKSPNYGWSSMNGSWLAFLNISPWHLWQTRDQKEQYCIFWMCFFFLCHPKVGLCSRKCHIAHNSGHQ